MEILGLIALAAVIYAIARPIISGYKSASIQVTGTINGVGTFDTEVVGESNYQKALKEITKAIGGKAPWPADAIVIPEPKNPHDMNAVRVDISEQTVGYLSREDAIAFHCLLQKMKAPNGAYQTKAKIFGGGEKHFGVWLDLTLE